MTNPLDAQSAPVLDTRRVELAVGDYVICHRSWSGMTAGKIVDIKKKVKIMTASSGDALWFDKNYVVKVERLPFSPGTVNTHAFGA